MTDSTPLTRRRGPSPNRSGAVASIVLAAPLLLGACAGNGFEPPGGEPAIDGFITVVNAPIGPSGDIRLYVQVDEVPGDSSGTPKFMLAIDDETQLLLWNDDAGGYGTFELVDLAQGQQVRVWVTGPVMESYPMQATAHTIVLLEEA